MEGRRQLLGLFFDFLFVKRFEFLNRETWKRFITIHFWIHIRCILHHGLVHCLQMLYTICKWSVHPCCKNDDIEVRVSEGRPTDATSNLF